MSLFRTLVAVAVVVDLEGQVAVPRDRLHAGIGVPEDRPAPRLREDRRDLVGGGAQGAHAGERVDAGGREADGEREDREGRQELEESDPRAER